MLQGYTVPHVFPVLSFKKTSARKDVMWARSGCPQSGMKVKAVLLLYSKALDAKADRVKLQKGIKLNEVEASEMLALRKHCFVSLQSTVQSKVLE